MGTGLHEPHVGGLAPREQGTGHTSRCCGGGATVLGVGVEGTQQSSEGQCAGMLRW